MAIWLNEAEVRSVLPPGELTDAIACALAAFSAGHVQQPVRTVLEIAKRSFFGLMPAFDRGQAILGAKLVTVLPGNATCGLPTHRAVIALFDPATGSLEAVLDGRYITEARTAAASAVSVRHMARAESRVLAILGSGVQAASHFEALRRERDFSEVRVWSPTPDHLARFVRERPCARPARTAEESVRGADVVVVATDSVTPAIENAWVGEGTHVIAVGACRPSQREIDPTLLARARLVVDSRAAALEESGDVVQSIREGRFTADHVAAELGDVVNGSKPGRTRPDEVTLFKSLGLAVEDLSAAHLAYRRARERGLGQNLAGA
jgi:alanine dehydrogenase